MSVFQVDCQDEKPRCSQHLWMPQESLNRLSELRPPASREDREPWRASVDSQRSITESATIKPSRSISPLVRGRLRSQIDTHQIAKGRASLDWAHNQKVFRFLFQSSSQ